VPVQRNDDRPVAPTRGGVTGSYDVVVVGGRVAGALTAVLFARNGLRVALVDRTEFPSSTLSTHFFRGDGLIRVLELAGLLRAVEDLGAPRLTCEYSYSDGFSDATVGPPQDPGDAGYCLSVRRKPLDATLLDAARHIGVDVRTATAVTGVAHVDDRVVGVQLTDGSALVADLVVGADGRRSMVARDVAAPYTECHVGRRALYYRYVRGFAAPRGGTPDGPEFSQLGDELAYVFPSDAGLTCIAISINLTEYEGFRHDSQARFDALLRRHHGLWDRYAASRPEGRLLGCGPQPDYVRRCAGPGWALVGDAGLHQDPWTGYGMDCAATTAALLVQAHGEAAGSEVWTETFQRRRDEQLLDGFHETVSGAADLSAIAG
jgi:menaquinone-9 beta-reductase